MTEEVLVEKMKGGASGIVQKVVLRYLEGESQRRDQGSTCTVSQKMKGIQIGTAEQSDQRIEGIIDEAEIADDRCRQPNRNSVGERTENRELRIGI